MDHAAASWAGLQAIRERGPLIHAITDPMAMETVANCLLAIFASPAMAHAEAEVEELAGRPAALVITSAPPGARPLDEAIVRAEVRIEG